MSPSTVVTYCIISLGKLRSRRYLPRLMHLFQEETNPYRRMMLSQAISNIVGIAHDDS
jgi:hypothetical protein